MWIGVMTTLSYLITNLLSAGSRVVAVPTRPTDRELQVQWAPWLRHWDEWGFIADTVGVRRQAAAGGARMEYRRVLIRDEGSDQRVRFNVAFHLDERQALTQTVTHGPIRSAADFRLPWATLSRIVQHVVEDPESEGEWRCAIRRGKLVDLDGDLHPGTRPQLRRHREPRKSVDLNEVARVYKEHPRAPTRAVAQHFKLKWRTAARRVRQARALGLLPAYTHKGPRRR
jgi:hypothetical protein